MSESEHGDDELLRRLRESPPPAMDPFTERRLRARVLGGQRPAAEVSARRYRALVLALGALVALAAALVFAWPRERARVADQAPWLLITPGAGASYEREDEDTAVRVTLRAGAATFAVGAHEEGRLTVVVPDGEIADLGTEFTVEVEQTRTLRIAVLRGSIVFRRNGAPELVIREGDGYEAELPVGAASASATSLHAVAAASGPERPSPDAVSSERPKMTSARPSRAAESAPKPSSPAGTSDAEDDAYLRVVALRREGRHDEARAAARDYLRRFPGGFRRVEMTRVAE